ncbi:SAM-dependent methyltransferase [Calditrichota bacterium]
MITSFEDDLAYSLEAKIELLPYIPYLLEDLWELGSSPELYVDLLKPLNLKPESTSVLDLGCGKGAVSITIAKKLDFGVFGIDACKSFLETAEMKAIEFGVQNLCQFEFGDMKEFVKTAKNFDIVIYAAIGNILGGVRDIINKLRRTIKSGGYILFDEGFLKNNATVDKEGYEHLLTHEETIKQLTSFGDSIIQEVILRDEDTKEINKKYIRLIKPKKEELSKKYPELKELFSWYIENQLAECEILDTQVSSAMWLLQIQ